MLLAAALVPRAMPASTTIATTYQYNADGALTAVTMQQNDEAPQTQYLTWDNFTPHADDPSAGRLYPADGNLLGIGLHPGASGLSLEFTYDQRDRVIGCRAIDQPSVAYAYHPASLMASSTLSGGDTLQFYYGTGGAPPMLNLRHPSGGETASFLGPVYYLSDGREQVLLGPRKDTAGAYLPAAQRLTPYAYDPYGAAPGESSQSSLPAGAAVYDLGQNPFRYAGEYLDPICATYYLRHRWYLPAQHTFLSRDRGDRLQRYGYAGGNPITRTDPTGLSWHSSFKRDVDRFVGRLGFGATALSLVPGIGEAVFGLQLAANAGTYFHSASNLAMLGVGVAAAVSEPLEVGRDLGTGATLFAGERFAAERYLSRPFSTRLLVDTVVGGGQSVIAGFHGDRHKRFDPVAFAENMGATAGWMLGGRVVAGIGYRPFNLSSHDVDAMVAQEYGSRSDGHDPAAAANGGALLFRKKSRLVSWLPVAFTSPLLEGTRLGVYHEALVGVGEGELTVSEVVAHEFAADQHETAPAVESIALGRRSATEALAAQGHHLGRFAFVGRAAGYGDLRAKLEVANPLEFPSVAAQQQRVGWQTPLLESGYSWWSANCHHHVAGVLADLQR